MVITVYIAQSYKTLSKIAPERNDDLLLTFEEQKASIARLNLIDNGFFQKIMQDSEICEEILRILLQMKQMFHNYIVLLIYLNP